MRLALALGVAVAGMAFGAAAETTREEHRVVINGPMGMHGLGDADADHDGWLSRAEASAQADRMFAEMDNNHDGKLDGTDHHEMGEGVRTFELHEGGPGDVTVHRSEGGDGDVRVETNENGQRTLTIIRRGDHDAPEADEHGADHADSDRRVERNVTIIRNGEHEHGDEHAAPHAMRVMHPPMFMMLMANSEEADRNGDHALSQEEFRAQHLRFFDASDANGDGKIRLPEMHAPPAPDAPPAPPPPPHRR